MKITTDRLVLRNFSENDLTDLFEYLSDGAVVKYEPYPPMSLEKVRDELNRRIESDEMVAVELKSGVAIYGGFNGTETSLSQRDFETNITILSGDVGAEGDYTDNTYHVVTGSGVDASAILDGFTISFS